MITETEIDSRSMGDPARFQTLADLERGLEGMPRQPGDEGRVALIVRRARPGRREILSDVELSPDRGLSGDAWGRGVSREADAQIAVMQRDVAELIANGQSLALFGDSLFVDIDLSRDNLPTRSQLVVGEAIVEITPLPHNGCVKFKGRFGPDALRFVAMPDQRPRNLRGIYVRVIAPGTVRIGDPVRVLSRTTPGERAGAT